jgi:hypothetical protein
MERIFKGLGYDEEGGTFVLSIGDNINPVTMKKVINLLLEEEIDLAKTANKKETNG